MAITIHNKSRPIGEADLMIACIAVSNKQILLTRNKKHFGQISGRKMESR
jgi:tRNA(fMet)-specific endonuclease VapC